MPASPSPTTEGGGDGAKGVPAAALVGNALSVATPPLASSVPAAGPLAAPTLEDEVAGSLPPPRPRDRVLLLGGASPKEMDLSVWRGHRGVGTQRVGKRDKR